MKNIVLHRRAAVRCWNVLGVISKARKRPELTPVLLRAREQKQTSADDLAQHLLFEPRSRRVVAERLLQIATNYGLLEQSERSFKLTPSGERALESEHVFVPERGTWTVWMSDDPLLGYPVLRVDPFREPSAFDEVHGSKNQSGSARVFADVPRELRAAVGQVASPPAGDGTLIRLDELGQKAERLTSNDSLQLTWSVGENRLRLEGSLGGARFDTIVEGPSAATKNVWRQLLEAAGQWSRWDGSRSALVVGFDETREQERESMLRDLVIDTPTLGALGKFDAVTVRGVPLQPRAGNDALRWAEWRLRERVRDYATSERFDAWMTEATAPFEAYRVSLPNRAALTKDIWTRRGECPPPIAWHLAAAEDWSL